MPGDARQLWLITQSSGAPTPGRIVDVAVRARTWRTEPFVVPDVLADRALPGALATVPRGPRATPTPGICLGVSTRNWDQTLRAVLDLQPGPAILSSALVELAHWLARYYVSTPWKAVSTILPAVLYRAVPRGVDVVSRLGVALPERLTTRQAAVLAALRDGPLPRRELLLRAAAGPSVLKRLAALGLVRVERQEAPQAVAAETSLAPTPEDNFALTAGQTAAVERLAAFARAPAFRVFLLFGVPGSGKTEVYVRAIRSVIEAGRQAILLIPEIALATQLVDRLRVRFPRVAVLHSRLTVATRAKTLRAVAAGQVDVVIGTRTAVFAPCPRLGLIVVDEEQETSFKNLASPLFHARDVAIKRGQLENVPVVLGSGTPSLETWHNLHARPTFELLRLPERVPGAELPRARHVLVRRRADGEELVSRELARDIDATLATGGQIVLLHNRRGYAVYLRCTRCGQAATCERCQATLVLHQPQRELRCHRCGSRRPLLERCPDDTCGGELRAGGGAIQKLEEELRVRFPAARLQRLDSDTMRRREDYAAALARFASGAADILLGTQMVAKGLDFPNVRLVGVIDADAALLLPDFRASERAFQMLVQVVGRAGRRQGASLAIVQTAEEPAGVIRAALRMDYEAMAAAELEFRRRLVLPPFVRLARVLFLDDRGGRARAAAGAAARALREAAARIRTDLRVDDASPCVIPRLRELRRYQVLVRSPSSTALHELLQRAASEGLLRGARRVVVDVDPVDVL